MKKVANVVPASKKKVRAAAEELGNKVLVAEGKKSLARKARIVKKTTKKAAKVGVIVGAVAAVAVVVREVRKRRKMDA